MTQQLINNRLDQLDPVYRDYVTSGEPSAIVTSLAEIHKLDEDSLLALENGFLLFLLFLMSKNDFTVFIVEECAINPEQAIHLTNAFLLALPSDIRSAYEKSLSSTPGLAVSKLMGDIKETESLLKTMPSVHTVSSVADTDTIYTSTQSAILQDSLHHQQK